MNTTPGEKLILTINILLLLVLLTILSLQLVIYKSNIATHNLLLQSSTNISVPTELQETNNDQIIELPEPTSREIIKTNRLGQDKLGWALIITNTLLILTALTGNSLLCKKRA